MGLIVKCFHRIGLALMALILLMAGAEGAWASPVPIVAASASSEEPGGGFGADRLIDGRVTTAWAEGASGSGTGSRFTLHLKERTELAKVRIWAGDWSSSAEFRVSGRPREVQLRFEDGSTQLASLPSTQEVVDIHLSPFVTTKSVDVTLIAVEEGEVPSPTMVSEVALFDVAPSERIQPKSIRERGESMGETSWIDDGMPDSNWCTRSKAPVELRVDFAMRQEVRRFTLANGDGRSPSAFLAGGRARRVTLRFDDGTRHAIDLAAKRLQQTFEVTRTFARYVDLLFNDVTPGTAFDGLCLSEAYFSHE